MELVSQEPEKAKGFLQQVLGWKFNDMPGMNYSVVDRPDFPGAGVRNSNPGEGPGTLSYVSVNSIEDTLAKAKAAGAQVLTPRAEVPNMGWMAAFLAPGAWSRGCGRPTPRPGSRRRGASGPAKGPAGPARGGPGAAGAITQTGGCRRQAAGLRRRRRPGP